MGEVETVLLILLIIIIIMWITTCWPYGFADGKNPWMEAVYLCVREVPKQISNRTNSISQPLWLHVPHMFLSLGRFYLCCKVILELLIYRVVQKSWRQVARIFLASCSEPQPAMPGWYLAKQSLFSAKPCTIWNGNELIDGWLRYSC